MYENTHEAAYQNVFAHVEVLRYPIKLLEFLLLYRKSAPTTKTIYKILRTKPYASAEPTTCGDYYMCFTFLPIQQEHVIVTA
jgi:hypothetical protein